MEAAAVATSTLIGAAPLAGASRTAPHLQASRRGSVSVSMTIGARSTTTAGGAAGAGAEAGSGVIAATAGSGTGATTGPDLVTVTVTGTGTTGGVVAGLGTGAVGTRMGAGRRGLTLAGPPTTCSARCRRR